MSKLLLSLTATLVLLGLAAPAGAAVGFDVGANNSAFTNCPTVNITVGSGSNRVLVVAVLTVIPGTAVVSSISGAGATWASVKDGSFVSGSGRSEIWHGTNPSSGAQTVTTTLSSTVNECAVQVWSFDGVDQTTPVASYTSANTYGLAVTTVSGDAAVVALETNDTLNAITGCQASDDLSLSSNAQYKAAHCLANAASMSITWTDGGASYATSGIAVKQVATSAYPALERGVRGLDRGVGLGARLALVAVILIYLSQLSALTGRRG